MRRPLPELIAAAVALVAISLLGASCGADVDEEKEVKEGEAVRIGAFRWNVQLARFLNPTDTEDRDYLTGQKPPPEDKDYLGVFIQLENESDQPAVVPEDLEVTDTRGVAYKPLESKSLYALPLGTAVPAHDDLPALNTTARSGPIKGAMVLFLVSEQSAQDRPLELEIPGPDGEHGTVELDI
jgi:hypothetical protein